MVTKTSKGTLGDFVKHEYDTRYTRKAGSWTNGTGAEVTLVAGEPFSINESTGVLTRITAGSEASAEGFLVSDNQKVVPDGDTVDLAIIYRGPGIVNKQHWTDEHSSLDADALEDVCDAMSPPLVVVDEPADAQMSEQTD